MKKNVKSKARRPNRFHRKALAAFLLLPHTAVFASDGSGIAVGVMGMVLCAALVFFMQSGFALLESGMVRSKNSINVIMKNYTDLIFGLLVYWSFGYGLMFGTNSSGFFGTSGFFPSELDNAGTVSMLYQMMFAATASTIISGAVAERMSYWPYVFASIFVTGLIYPVFGSWVWNENGWLAGLGFVDLAGSTVVHAIGGWSALAAVLVLGPRTGRYGRDGSIRDIPGHNLPYIAMGGFILWLGWFGFNGGSAASLDDVGKIVLNTQLAGAGGGAGALMTMVLFRQPVLMTNTVNGALGGLVASCAGAATMDPAFAIITGLVAGNLVVLGSRALVSMGIDDVVGAVSVHGIAGSWGTLAAGMFYAGEMFEISRVTVQLLGIVLALLWGFGMSLAIYKMVDIFIGLRATKLHEQRGLDYSEHYEIGYTEFQATTTHRDKGRNFGERSPNTA